MTSSMKAASARAGYVDFGSKVWAAVQSQPLGSLPKREMELLLLRAAIDAGLVEPEPSKIAQTFCIPLTRSHGYLTELALRQPPLSDADAVSRLIALLRECEVVKDDAYLSLPLHDAALRIWLERKMAVLSLNAGDVVRRDLIKLTPAGLAKLLGASDGIATPYEALRSLPLELKEQAWVKEAKKFWTKASKWPEAISALGNTATVAQTVIPALFRVFGA